MAERPVTSKNISVRMFRSDLLESFSHIHPATPLVLGIPTFLAMVVWALAALRMPLGAFLLGLAGGLLLWTLLEYLLHRFVFHFEPRSGWGKKVHFTVHGVHHAYPQDATRLVMPPVLSIPLGMATFGLLWNTLGAPWTPAVFSGLVIGYMAYDTIHFAVHHLHFRNRVFQALKKQHVRHHFQDPHRGYGVSTPFWDLVFGTRLGRRGQERRERAQDPT